MHLRTLDTINTDVSPYVSKNANARNLAVGPSVLKAIETTTPVQPHWGSTLKIFQAPILSKPLSVLSGITVSADNTKNTTAYCCVVLTTSEECDGKKPPSRRLTPTTNGAPTSKARHIAVLDNRAASSGYLPLQ
jgi:hypothetical protein